MNSAAFREAVQMLKDDQRFFNSVGEVVLRHRQERRLQLEERARTQEEHNRELERKLREEKRRNLVDQAIGQGRISAGDRTALEQMYDADQDAARAFVAELAQGDSPATAQATAELERRFGDDLAVRLGVKPEELI